MPSVQIDLITQDFQNDEFVLILVEDGPWPNKTHDWEECLRRIQARVFDAIDVAVDGHLAEKYADSKGKKIRVQIDSPHGTPRQLADFISRIRDHISEFGTNYQKSIAQSPHIKGLYVVAGQERNPFN